MVFFEPTAVWAVWAVCETVRCVVETAGWTAPRALVARCSEGRLAIWVVDPPVGQGEVCEPPAPVCTEPPDEGGFAPPPELPVWVDPGQPAKAPPAANASARTMVAPIALFLSRLPAPDAGWPITTSIDMPLSLVCNSG